MLVRYTRQLATAALIVAAGLGMGACSAHPGAAVSTSNGDYSIAEVDEAVAQLNGSDGRAEWGWRTAGACLSRQWSAAPRPWGPPWASL